MKTEQLVLWTPLGSHPHAASGRNLTAATTGFYFLALALSWTPEVRGEKPVLSDLPPLQSDCSQLLLLFKAKGSFANHLSQCKRGLELKTVEKYKERELAGQRQCKEGSSLSKWVTSSTITWSDLSRIEERDRVLCGLALWYVTPGPVGHVSASIWQWVEGVKNVCCLRTDVYFGCVQIHSFVEVPLKLVVSSSFALSWEIQIWILLSPNHMCTRPKTAWD